MANEPANPLRGELTWTDATGKHKFEASLVSHDEEKVELKNNEAKVISVELTKLSRDNRQYIKFLQQIGIEVFDDLTCDTQQKRQEAAKRLQGAELPSMTLPAVSRYIDLEIKALTDQQNVNPNGRKEITKIPFKGNETSLVRIKADPQKYLGESIFIVGGIQSSSYYNYGYNNAETSHFSLDFTELDSEAKFSRNRANLYVPRSFSNFLIERMNRREEAGKGLLIRAKVTLDPNRFDGASSWRFLELQDWQLIHPNKQEWQAWSLEGFNVALGILSSFKKLEPLSTILTKTESYGNDLSDLYVRSLVGAALLKHEFDRKDIGVLVQVICSDNYYATTESDSVVRTVAIAALRKQNDSDKRYAARKIKREISIAKRNKKEHVLNWGTKAYNQLVR